MRRIFLLLSILSIFCAAFACQKEKLAVTGHASPTEAYKALFAAVKSKDIEAIKKNISKKTVELGKMSMERYKKSEKEAYENGFTATTMTENLPSIRDERIKDNFGALEVWNSQESRWDDVAFVFEDGGWKLGMGDAFSGSFQSPGPGRDFREKEAANAMAKGPAPQGSTANSNGVSPAGNKK
jgi:hypothetical protein